MNEYYLVLEENEARNNRIKNFRINRKVLKMYAELDEEAKKLEGNKLNFKVAFIDWMNGFSFTAELSIKEMRQFLKLDCKKNFQLYNFIMVKFSIDIRGKISRAINTERYLEMENELYNKQFNNKGELK